MNHFARIKGVKDSENGTDIIIHIPDKQLSEEIIRKRIKEAEVRLDDGRTISNEQRKKIYATIKDIADWYCDLPEYMKEDLKYGYCISTGEEYFSFSSCSMDTAREFINYMMDLALKYGIPLKDLGVNRTDDMNRYLFCCLKYRKCAITGNPNADIHHVEGSRIGMGNNRKKVSHVGRELIALSREWHKRVHDEGEEEIFKDYKIYGIALDAQTLVDLKISNEDIT